jgi:hypothetical protein
VTETPVTDTAKIGPPVPFDPECAAALELVLPFIPKVESVESIPGARASISSAMQEISDEMLSRNGAFNVEALQHPRRWHDRGQLPSDQR